LAVGGAQPALVPLSCDVAIIGGGPAGLFAAERLAAAGHSVILFEKMPSVGRKFLLAGRGGLNLTHSEPLEAFAGRYGARTLAILPLLERFTPADMRAWAQALGQETFIGSSGRVFPQSFKASPLLRAWLRRLEGLGVRILTRHRWTGFDPDGMPVFSGPDGEPVNVQARAALLALGGASWPRLGSDGAWVSVLESLNVPVAPLKPANCGIEIGWSDVMQARGAGQPLKRISISGGGKTARGEAMITAEGLEGGAVYAILDGVRDEMMREGHSAITLDLKPDRNLEGLVHDIARTPAGQSTANRLRKGAKLDAAAILLLNEVVRPLPREAGQLAALIKSVPIVARGVRPIERAISTAGGVPFEAMTGGLMVMAKPGLFLAGEMLDWEAPTGGYLLQGCFASAAAAADGIVQFLATVPEASEIELPLRGADRDDPDMELN
jgi:uncharacterized flavoprotein (TIGR03862 family)